MMRQIAVGWTVFGSMGWAMSAETLNLFPAADTGIAEIAPNNNFGGADYFNAGTAKNGNRNRGLLWFDVTSGLPPGAVITSADLLLDVVRNPVGGGEPSTFGLHRLLQPWGEGMEVPDAGSPGLGRPASAGAATWLNRFALSAEPWMAAGGASGIDFIAAASADQFIYGTGDSPYWFASTPALVADVQYWVDHPQLDFGWLLMSDAEGTPGTARSFGSRDGIAPPVLQLEFTIVPEPGTLLLAGLAIGVFWGTMRSVRNVG